MAKFSLVDLRDLLGWTQARLSTESGVKVTAISDIENGRTANPGYVTVMRLVNALQRAGLSGLKADQVFAVPEHEGVEAR